MSFEHVEAGWIDERGDLTIVELTQCSGLTPEDVRDLVELGALVPASGGDEPVFPPSCIAAARVAARLRRDFELDTSGLALALALIERIESLEAELRAARARQPRRLAPS